MIDVQNITKSFGSLQVLKGISYSIDQGAGMSGEQKDKCENEYVKAAYARVQWPDLGCRRPARSAPVAAC